MTSSYKSPLEMLYHWEKVSPNKVYLRQAENGVWKNYNWREFGLEVRGIAAYIESLKLPPKSHIALLSKNCAQWLAIDLAIWMSGHVSIPIYPSLTGEGVKAILEHSESKLLFVGKLDSWEAQKNALPSALKKVYLPYPNSTVAGETVTRWDEVLACPPLSGEVRAKLSGLATIIYTSGTTGEPKGVMHSFESLSLIGSEACTELGFDSRDRMFSFLPLAHVAERALIEICGLYSGAEIGFAESLDSFNENLREISPTVFLAVPRIWMKFQQGVLAKVPQKKLDLFLKIPVLAGFIRRKILKGLGLNSIRMAISGAAPISMSLLEWYQKLGLPVQEGYAMTENFCYSHVNRRRHIRIGSVGQPFPHMDAKLSAEGEILVRGPSTMLGYFKNPELSAETVVHGYLRTGDRGEIDAENFLMITGRVKDLFKSSKGKYIAPSPLEVQLQKSNLIDQVAVVGSSLPQPIALVVLSDAAKKLARAEINTELSAHLKSVNALREAHEKIDRLIIVQDMWSVENDLLTPTLKIKRHSIEKKYGHHFETWSRLRDPIIFEG